MMDFAALAALDGNDLTRLAALLEAGLLKPPLGVLTLQGHVPGAHTGALSECLEDLACQGMPPDHVAAVLRAFAAGRQAGGVSAPLEVVVSGPDAAATARNTGVVVRQLFDRARMRVLAVGFAVHQGKSVFQALARRLDADEMPAGPRRSQGHTGNAARHRRTLMDRRESFYRKLLERSRTSPIPVPARPKPASSMSAC